MDENCIVNEEDDIPLQETMRQRKNHTVKHSDTINNEEDYMHIHMMVEIIVALQIT